MRKHVPNILTLLNLFSGCIAITMAFKSNFEGVVIWVAIAALFDFLDGMAARILKTFSPLGKELDSLADVVSFGVAPATALFILMNNHFLLYVSPHTISHFAPYLSFIIPMFAAYRLAKFNIDERQSTTFFGLPTPANGLFWISYCYGLHKLTPLNDLIFQIVH
jgi:CDP-diacylglycerol--serine O-phosphatidyltransferase